MLNPRGGKIHCLGEEAAPVLSPKPPTCSHSAVVASAAKGQLSLGSLNPKTLKQHQSFIQDRLTEANKQKEELEENNMKIWQVLFPRVQYLLV